MKRRQFLSVVLPVLTLCGCESGPKCHECKGKGQTVCYACKGKGELRYDPHEFGSETTCSACSGTGKIACSTCQGSGKGRAPGT
jgi:DnaJ-class molecular chaperone